MAPSPSARALSGMTSSGSTSSLLPSPVQAGQAPCGLLKEKFRGASSSIEKPSYGQAKFWLKSSSSALRALHPLVVDLLRRLAGDLVPADRAVRMADPRPHQAHVVIDLGHRADRRARVVAGALLVDRDRRG